MGIVTAQEFRANQTKILKAAKNGQSVILTSRVGSFKITPINSNDSLIADDVTSNIIQGLNDVKLIEEGKLPSKSAKSFLDEL